MAVAARRRRLLAASLGGLAAIMLAAAPAASAHAVLQSSTPAAGSISRTGASVPVVELAFDEPVEASLGAVQVVDAGGARVDTGSVTHPGGTGERVAVRLRGALAQGSYLVLWHVVSADSHPVHGSFTFAIGHPGTVAATTGISSPHSVALVLGITRFAGYSGLMLVVGLVIFLLFCEPGLWSHRRTRTLAVTAFAVTGAGTVVGFALQAALDVGGSWSAALNVANLRALSVTRLGHAHLIRVALLLLWLAGRPKSRPGPGTRSALAALTLAMVATVAVEGHGGRDGLTTVVDIAHVTAAGAWLGGLVVLLVLVLPQYRSPAAMLDPPGPAAGNLPRPSEPTEPAAVAVLERTRIERLSWAPVRRFSAVAATAVAVLVSTGVLQSVRQLPEWGALTGTTYGRELLLKIALVAATLAVAGWSSGLLHTRLGGSDQGRQGRLLMTTVATETALAVLVLAVTSALVATTPAAAAYRPAQDRRVHAGPITLDISAVAPAARTLDVHLYAYGADGTLADIAKITAEASPPAGTVGLGPITLPLLQAGTGHFLASRLLLPRTGAWTLTLIVQTGAFDAYTAIASLTVR